MDYNKNQQVELQITDISETGEGIGHIDGYTLFVKDAYPGDIVIAKITKIKKNYGFARLIEIKEPSGCRVDPSCKICRSCGGCQIQALSYEAQLKYKYDKVYGNLKRIGGFEEKILNGVFEPIIGMDDPFRYRNKAQFPIGIDKSGNVVAGFYAGRTHDIIPCEDCIIGIEENKQILAIITEHMEEYKIPAYDERSGRGLIRHVLIRKGFKSDELMVCIVISKKGKNGKFIPGEDELVKKLAEIDGMASVSVSVNTENTNVIMGNEIHNLWGNTVINDILLNKKYRISPLAFYQVNHDQCEKLYSKVIDFAELTGNEEVWDICCGIGTIALSVADMAKKVHGIEIVPEAIEDAKYNASQNNIENAGFICEDATEYLRKNHENMKADVIIMDPPRKGMTSEALSAVIDVSPQKIVYVSCDPATLARDLKILCDGGYELKRVCPVDMFPHSVHVETVVLLSKGVIDFQKVKVDFSLKDMDITSFRGKATYEQIKEYVLQQTGMKVSLCTFPR